MRIKPLLLLLAVAPYAGELSPYFLANAGLTLPKTELDFDDDDINQDDLMGYSATVGLGVRMPLNPQIDFDGFAGFSLVSGGVKLESEYSGEQYYYNSTSYTGSGYYDYTNEQSIEASVYPKLFDLGGGIVYRASPKIAIGGGIVFSIPVGGTYEVTMKEEMTSDCPSGATSCVSSASESDDEDGDIEDFEDDADVKVKSFLNLKFTGEYAVNDRLSLTAGWMLPVGDYLDEENTTISWSRTVVGIKYSFSATPGSDAAAIPASSTTLAQR